MTLILESLKKNIQGETFFDQTTLQSFSTDESIFKIDPQVVVCPKNEKDVQAIVEIAAEFQTPITARGGGTGVAGQSIGRGIIVDFSKHMNRILEINHAQAIVEPGLVLGNLNQKANTLGSKFGPDPGSWDKCTIGGMIANNAAGPHALKYGSTRDHIDSMNLVLSNAKSTDTKQLAKEMGMYVAMIQKNAPLIRAAKRDVDKNSSGYHLEGLLETPPSFEKLIAGSEGTLAMVTQATLKLVPLPEKVSFAIFGFESMGKALMSVKELRLSGASSIELVDSVILNVVKKENPDLIRELGLENSNASLWVEWYDEMPATWKKQASFTADQPGDIRRIWNHRSQFSRWLHAQAEKQNRKPLRCIEDACLPIDELVTYVMGLQELMEAHDCKGAIFGHVGNGHLHVNPAIRTDLPNLSGRVQRLMDQFYDLVLQLGGTISGEHGDGILRVPYAKKQWREIWPLFEFVKKSFDPKGIFNPDRKVPLAETKFPALKY